MRLAEAEQDIGKQPIPLTTLTLIEEYGNPDHPFYPQPPDPPDPPDLPGSANNKAEQLQQFTQKESKVLKSQDMWLIPELTPSDKNSKEPNTDLHTDNDFKANLRKKDQKVRNGKRKDIPVVTRKSLRQEEESYPAETTTAPDNQYHIPSDELYGNKAGGFDQQFTGDKIPRGKDNDKRQSESSFHNQKEDSFQENPRLQSPEEKLNGKGTSGPPHINTAVHPTSIPPLDIKWHVAHGQTKRDENRRYKVKRKKKKLQDPEESNNESLIVASGFIAGLIALLGTIMSIFMLR